MTKPLYKFIEELKKNNFLISSNATEKEMPVKGITFNSRDVQDGFMFICKGAAFKEAYLQDAIKRGAVCFVKEEYLILESQYDIPYIEVSDIRAAMPIIARVFYGDVSSVLKVVGITGTKGKSTTTYYMKHILDEFLGKRSSICSGIDTYDGVIDEASKLTTPENFDIYKHMYNSIESDIPYMTLEVSSQALKYNRVDTINLAVGCFLNIGEDHISDIEHPTYEDYFESKLKIIDNSNIFCYNLDCEEQEAIRERLKSDKKVVTFSHKNNNANVFAYDIKSNEGKVTFTCRGRNIENYPDFEEEFTLGTFGLINVENALAAIAMSAALNIPIQFIKTGLEKTKVPGRMEVFRNGGKVVVVDFAHNGLSFTNFYINAQKEFPNKKIISVFGATGGKAINRRKDLAEASSKYSSYIILTEDDPGKENPLDICNEMKQIIDAYNVPCEIILDRPEAIKKAISMMDDDTVLFLAGKGRDNKQKRNGSSVVIKSDIETVNEFL